MKQLLTSTQMKQYDNYTIEQKGIPSLVLMERAALAVVKELERSQYGKDHILILCGTGNNGADGLAIARMLTINNYTVSVKMIGNESQMTEEAKIQKKIAQNFNVNFVQDIKVCEYTTIVDAIFGVGLKRPITGMYQEIIEYINTLHVPIVSVDIPSGVDATTGKVLGCGVKAQTTVTFSFEKVGQYLYPGSSYCGKVICEEIGIVSDPQKTQEVYYALEHTDLNLIPLRNPNGNKGTFGKVLLIAGNEDICGAAYLSALASFRMGVGMVKIFTHEKNKPILHHMIPEAMISVYTNDHPNLQQLKQDYEWADVVGIGPGLGTCQIGDTLIEFILNNSKKPLVIDADGISLLKNHMELLHNYNNTCILTPHIGEMARLLSLSAKEVIDNRMQLADDFSKKYQVTLVLKDARTLINVKGLYQYINISGNEGMATAGSGDVLTGILLGLLTQGISESYVASLGVYIHGVLGDIAKKKLGSSYMMATDLIKAIPKILE